MKMRLKGYSYRCDFCGITPPWYLRWHYCNECENAICHDCWEVTVAYHLLGRCAKGFKSEPGEMEFRLNDFVPI